MLLLLSFLCLVSFASAAYWAGTVDAKDDWLFIERFAFDKTGTANSSSQLGHLSGNISISAELAAKMLATNPPQAIAVLLYYDSEENWASTYKNAALSCAQKSARRHAEVRFGPGKGGEFEFNVGDTNAPHMWYFAFAACGVQLPWRFAFTMHATQPDGSEVSVDDQGILSLHVVMFCAYVALGAVHALSVVRHWRATTYHAVLRLGTAALATEAASQVCYMLHWAVYARDGVGVPGLAALAEMASMATQTLLICFATLIVAGYGVTGKPMRARQTVTAAAAFLALVYLVLFLWQRIGHDRASTLYVYDSWPGALVLVVRAAAFGVFLLALRQTLRGGGALAYDARQQEGLRAFACFYGCWWWMLLFVVIVGALFPAFDVSSGVYSLRFIVTIQNLSTLAALAFFALIAWPAVSARYFNFGDGQEDRLIAEAAPAETPSLITDEQL